MTTGIVWFRQDLRLSDNPALSAACRECDQVLAVFIADPLDQTVSQIGEASRVWLHHSLADLQASFERKGSTLLFAQGASLAVLETLIKQSGASRLYWNRCYDPVSIKRDTDIKASLAKCSPRTFNGLLIQEPWDTLKSDGSPYRVYTPFWRAGAKQLVEDPSALEVIPAPAKLPALPNDVLKRLTVSVPLSKLNLLPGKGWDTPMMSHWRVGEKAARAQLGRFLANGVSSYDTGRNLPAEAGTSRMSPHLHLGEISPRYVLQRLLKGRQIAELQGAEEIFAKEIFWREFAYALLYHFPQTVDEPLDTRFERFKWADGVEGQLRAWQRGQTGVPIVDAGMRQLYATGWMHNRVRMIVASYLIKNLLIPWQQGEQWFRNTLVDADMASNVMGWQWSAGSGADAAPFFRIFNPILQGEKFDKQGDYVRHWVPELAQLPASYIHKPWELSPIEREELDYPAPLVDLKASRERALSAFSNMKGTN